MHFMQFMNMEFNEDYIFTRLMCKVSTRNTMESNRIPKEY